MGLQRVRHDLATEQLKKKGFPRGLSGKESACNSGEARDTDLSLGQEDSLEEEMATHYSILAWEIPGTEAVYCRHGDLFCFIW